MPNSLLSPYVLDDLVLKNRMVMAPMTRSRAIEGNISHPLAPVYYAQRATAGLIITEATQVSPQGVGYIRTPGIHSAEQVAAWRQVTEAVHQAGGKICAQLWHVGRISHTEFHEGAPPVAPSALQADAEVFISSGRVAASMQRALETAEISSVVEQFRKAARNADDAGFDGVELHGASGYLLDQFLRDGSNIREDRYGGTLINRAHFPIEVAAAVADVLGSGRVGYRIGPNDGVHGMKDSDPVRTFTYLATELDRVGIAYLHVVEPIAGDDALPPDTVRVAPYLRSVFSRTLILNGGYDFALGEAAIRNGNADLISFGVPFLANPDLPERFKRSAPLNAPNYPTFYQPSEDAAEGYTDYPMLAVQ